MRTEPDACPYPKPFPEGFSDCPAFQPSAFLPRTSREAPLRERWTCAHLSVGDARGGAFYPRCRLGTASDREAWATEHAAMRQLLRELRYDIFGTLAPRLPELLAAQRLVREDGGRAFDVVAAPFVAAADAWFEARATDLDRLGITVDAGRGIVRETLAAWRAQPSPINTAEPPAQVVLRYPEVAELLLPGD